MKLVIFACVHSAGRSQMAAAYFNALVRPEIAQAISAGTEPAARVHPEVVTAMAEVGIDVSQSQPTLLTEDLAKKSYLLITMGCGEKCPHVPGVERKDWPLQDPKGQDLDHVRVIRNQIKELVTSLLQTKGWR